MANQSDALSPNGVGTSPKTPDAIKATIDAFRISLLADHTHQVKRQNTRSGPMCFDFSRDQLASLLNDSSWASLRIHFAIEDGSNPDNGYLSVVLEGVSKPAVNEAVNGLVANMADDGPGTLVCCGTPPPGN